MDEEPEGEEGEESGKGEGGGGRLGPHEEVEDEGRDEEEAGEEEGGDDGVVPPVGAAEGFVAAGREVAGEEASKDEEPRPNRDETAAKGGVEKTKGGEEQQRY